MDRFYKCCAAYHTRPRIAPVRSERFVRFFLSRSVSPEQSRFNVGDRINDLLRADEEIPKAATGVLSYRSEVNRGSIDDAAR